MPERTALRHFRLWLAAGWLDILLIVYLSLTPHPPHGPDIPGADKIGHFGAYGILMYWFCLLYPMLPRRILLGAMFILLGVVLEFVQGWTGFRNFELWDMAADAGGVVLGLATALLVRNNLLLSIEKWLH